MKDYEVFEPVQVINRGEESIERMIKRFNKKLKKDGILEESQRRRYFIKPSDKKRRARARQNYINRMRRKFRKE